MPQHEHLRPTWSHVTNARLMGVALAREAGLVLAWDTAQRLYLWDRQGQRLAQQAVHFPLASAAISDDGSRIAVAGSDGQLWWLNRDLQLMLDQKLEGPLLAVALDSLGLVAAVSAASGRTRLITRFGHEICSCKPSRPLRYLQFLATESTLLGAADYGFVGGFDPTGHTKWCATPLSRAGSLAADGAGERVLLACYSSGILRYDRAGQALKSLPTPQPCRLAACDFEHTRLLVAYEDSSLALLKPDGEVTCSLALANSAIALCLGPLGNWGVVGLADGTVLALEVG